ncbi:MAG: AEC family transporter [Pyramidobacter sp.]|nr:AEC family transporter [Pyramidobacter sp.]
MLSAFLLILPIMLCIAFGWLLKHRGILTDRGAADMNSFIFYGAMPAILFRTTLRVEAEHFSDWHFLAVIHGVYFALLAAAWFGSGARGFDVKKRASSVLMAIRSNNVFMGMPAALMLWGDEGSVSFARFVALSVLGFEVLSAMFGLMARSGGFSLHSLKRVLLKLPRNPLVVAVVAGLAWGLLVPFEFPKWLDETLKIIGNTGTGIALATLGMRLNLSTLLSDLARSWSDILIRLVLSPVLLAVGFYFLPTDALLMKTSILIMSMPVAVNSFTLAEEFDLDSDYAAQTIVATTIASVVTLPVVISFLL